MRKMTLATLLLLSFSSGSAYSAIPYHGKHIEYKQPNGEVITLVLEGNDYYAEQRTLAGRLVIYDKDLEGMAYAKVSSDGKSLVSTHELASQKPKKQGILSASKLVTQPQKGLTNKAKQSIIRKNRDALLKIKDPNDYLRSSLSVQKKNSTLSGEVKGLTVLINFPDEKSAIDRSQINRFLNDLNYKEFGNFQSIRGYFKSVSGGKLDYTNTVTTYYTAKHNKAYYTDPNVAFTVRTQELIHEALDWLEYQQGFDFSTLTTNNNGLIKGLNFMYAGASDGAWSQGLWPHMGGLSPRFCADGVCTDRYQITNIAQSLSIGTFAHESGHLIADWPDLYDYDGSSQGSVASYGIMGYGGVGYRSKYHPTPPVAPLRDLVGWEQTTELNPAVNANAPTGEIISQSGANQAYKWSNPNNAAESFYIEAIHRSGQNSEQPGSGLAIFHVDENGDRDNEWHPYIQMEHADGNRDPENNVNQGDANDVYKEYGEFTATLPNALTSKGTNSLWWSGQKSGLNISQVSQPAQSISFVSSPNQAPSQGGNDNTDDRVIGTYTGSINQGQSIIEPNGSYFEFNGQTVFAGLNSTANTDLGLFLYQLVNNQWTLVASARNNNSQPETISYSGGKGYYYVVISSYSGTADYNLTIAKQQ